MTPGASADTTTAPETTGATSEYAATPRRVVVHDPAAVGALEELAGLREEELQERCLFRAPPDPGLFAAEHAELVTALRDAGVETIPLRDLVGRRELESNPNQVYTRDAAFTLPWLPGAYVRGAMRMPARRAEPAVMAAALRELGLRELFAVPPGRFLEGGDVIPVVLDGRRTLLVGFGPCTARESVDLLWERLAPWALDAVVGVQLAPWRMNLDGALVPVADDTLVAHPASVEGGLVVDAAGRRPVDVLALLRAAGMTVVDVTREEATAGQACNILCLGDGRVVCYDRCRRVLDALRRRGLDVRTIPSAELIKGTGGPRCMTRPVYS